MLKMLTWMQWIGWMIIVLLCICVALLWRRLEHQVVQAQHDIAALQAESTAEDRALEARLSIAREALEIRFAANAQVLKRILRDYHQQLIELSVGRREVSPLDPWLQEHP